MAAFPYDRWRWPRRTRIRLEHGDEDQGLDASDFDRGDSQWMAVEIGLIFAQIGDLKRLLGLGNAAYGSCAAHCGAFPLLHVGRLQRPVKRSVAETISFPEPHS